MLSVVALKTNLSIRLLVLAAFCLAGASVSVGQEGRYLAVFADGRRVVGEELAETDLSGR